MHRWVLLVGLGLASCGGGESRSPAATVATTGAVAGEVIEVQGEVTATRAGATRVLAVGAAVHDDDAIATGASGRISIKLARNEVTWRLGPQMNQVVAQSAAWTAPRASGDVAGISGDRSAAAGRHAEREAADTAASQIDERAPAMAPPAAAPAAAMADPDPAMAAAIEAQRDGAARPRMAAGARREESARELADSLVGVDGKASGGGMSGLGLSGSGEGGGAGGGATGGLGNIGTIGHGSGTGKGRGYGAGPAAGGGAATGAGAGSDLDREDDAEPPPPPAALRNPEAARAAPADPVPPPPPPPPNDGAPGGPPPNLGAPGGPPPPAPLPAPVVTFDLKVSGSRTGVDVGKVFFGARAALTRCVASTGEATSARYHVTIDATGKPIAIRWSLGSAAFRTCAEPAINGLRFAPAPGTTDVTQNVFIKR